MKHPTEVFDEWAIIGKDKGMEASHSASVSEILDFAISQIEKNCAEFKFLDFGCGNGWVIRKVSENKKCEKAIGVDGSKKMIAKAKKLLPRHEYHCADIMTWRPHEKVNIVHSMEVIYYVEDPKKLINDIVRVSVLEEEIEYYKTLIQPEDTGHIHTTISFLKDRLRNLKGEKEWPFV